MPVPIFLGFVERSKLTLDDRPGFMDYMRTFEGREVEITIRKRRSQRSLDQNAYWWAVPVRILADHCGYSDEQMHYALMGACFGYTAGPTGSQIPNKPSSSHLTVEEFTRLIEWVLIFGPTELGCIIPSPEKVEAA